MRKYLWVVCCAVVALLGSWMAPRGFAQFGGGEFGGGIDQPPTAVEPTPAEAGPEGGVLQKGRGKGGPGMGMGRGEMGMLIGPGAAAEKSPSEFCHCVGQDGGTSVAKIKQALAAQLRSSGVEFVDTHLSEVVMQLSDDYGIPIQLDPVALDAVGIRPDEPVNVNLQNISLQSALRLMLKRLQLTYIIQDEVLIVTSPDEAEKQLIVCVYDVRDLIDGGKDLAGLKSLSDVIASTAHTETWAVNGGGEAEIKPLKPGILVISQTQAVHDEVRGLLDGIRQTRRQPAAGIAAAVVPDLNNASASPAEKVVTRNYPLQINLSSDHDQLRQQIYSMITKVLPDENWGGTMDGQEVVLMVLPDRIIVRHNQAAQDKVQALLVDSGLAAPTAAAPGMMGMEGGFGRGGGGGGGGMGGFGERAAGRGFGGSFGETQVKSLGE